MRVIQNKNMCVELTRMLVVKKNNNKKAKHGAGGCRSKVYVHYMYYDEF
jgi:hypothetical protein